MAQKSTQKTSEEMSFEDYNKQILEAVKGWEEEVVGFPPYWTPELGKMLLGRLLLADLRDPNFGRYVMQATQVPVQCQRGPADDAEPVIVQPGEFFTMSVYGGLPVDSMENFFDLELCLTPFNKRRLPPNEASQGKPRDFWDFKVIVAPESKKILTARKKEQGDRLIATRKRQAELDAKAAEAIT